MSELKMKLSFSTVGCPDWKFGDIIAAAIDLGYDAIEIRGIENEMYAPKIKEFSESHIEMTKERLSKANIKVSMLASNAEIGNRKNANYTRQEAFDYVDLASEIGAPFVRLLISPRPEADEADLETAALLYDEICEYAKGKNVTPLVETNGIFADSTECKKFIEKIKSGNKGVLWDINHPVVFYGEDFEKTFDNIGKFVKYLHIKDSVVENGKIAYKMCGHGNLPIKEIITKMNSINYTGYLSLEWTKRWCPELDEAGIVFMQYITYIKQILKKI